MSTSRKNELLPQAHNKYRKAMTPTPPPLNTKNLGHLNGLNQSSQRHQKPKSSNNEYPDQAPKTTNNKTPMTKVSSTVSRTLSQMSEIEAKIDEKFNRIMELLDKLAMQCHDPSTKRQNDKVIEEPKQLRDNYMPFCMQKRYLQKQLPKLLNTSATGFLPIHIKKAKATENHVYLATKTCQKQYPTPNNTIHHTNQPCITSAPIPAYFKYNPPDPTGNKTEQDPCKAAVGLQIPTQLCPKHHPPKNTTSNTNQHHLLLVPTSEYIKHNPPDKAGNNIEQDPCTKIDSTTKTFKHDPPDPDQHHNLPRTQLRPHITTVTKTFKHQPPTKSH